MGLRIRETLIAGLAKVSSVYSTDMYARLGNDCVLYRFLVGGYVRTRAQTKTFFYSDAAVRPYSYAFCYAKFNPNGTVKCKQIPT